MTILKRAKRLWTLLSTEEVYDQYGSRGRRREWCAGGHVTSSVPSWGPGSWQGLRPFPFSPLFTELPGS